ncbi:MAG: universal stress protein, partial [Candidatus Electrothrix sp. AUS1_2]|nr:universal stress protein [Candidatus Electrothrix sp. AUS1_2]
MSEKRRAATRKSTIYGIVVIILYSLLLARQDFINANFARGGWYALLPIITAFIFSLAHGKFTGSFWSVLG